MREPTLMMRPSRAAIISGRTARVKCTAPITLTSNMRDPLAGIGFEERSVAADAGAIDEHGRGAHVVANFWQARTRDGRGVGNVADESGGVRRMDAAVAGDFAERLGILIDEGEAARFFRGSPPRPPGRCGCRSPWEL